MKHILTAEGITAKYQAENGEITAAEQIDLTVEEGEFVSIVGPSGCGKSTLLTMLSGLTQPEKGTISIDGAPLSKAHSAIGYMLQKDHLFEWRNIFSNISLGLEIQKRLDEPARLELLDMMSAYGLAGFEYAKPSELSGGMRQRAALIRTLALKPDILLLDEPFSALDYQTRLSVCDDISSIIRRTHKTAILVTHDLSEAISVADRIVVLSARPGRVKSVLSIDFPEGCTRSLDRRNCPEFSNYFNTVWKELKTYES